MRATERAQTFENAQATSLKITFFKIEYGLETCFKKKIHIFKKLTSFFLKHWRSTIILGILWKVFRRIWRV